MKIIAETFKSNYLSSFNKQSNYYVCMLNNIDTFQLYEKFVDFCVRNKFKQNIKSLDKFIKNQFSKFLNNIIKSELTKKDLKNLYGKSSYYIIEQMKIQQLTPI